MIECYDLAIVRLRELPPGTSHQPAQRQQLLPIVLAATAAKNRSHIRTLSGLQKNNHNQGNTNNNMYNNKYN